MRHAENVSPIKTSPSPLSSVEALRLPFTVLCAAFLALSYVPGWSVLALVSVLLGAPFAVDTAWQSLRQRNLDVNLLMVLAAAGAIAVGQSRDAAVLLFLFSLSTLLESIAMARTKSAIAGLVRLRPSQALLLRDGKTESVPVESVEIGDLVRVPAFESVPLDGEVVEGQSSIDASAMSGEAAPVSVAAGAAVVGGTQNLDGVLLVRVSAVVGDSALDRIVDLVRDAQDNKASGERVSQWFGQRYTAFVLVAFAASFGVRLALGEVGGTAFYTSLTLLVGLSPCALVISTPATTLSALTWCAKHGILVRGGEYIERAGNVRIVALDKTGTLTEGRPSLRAVALEEHAGSISEWSAGIPMSKSVGLALGLAAAVERDATHPLALAVVRAAEGQTHLKAEGGRVEPGLGICANVNGETVLVGSERLLTEHGVAIPPTLHLAIDRMRADGMTVSLMARSGAIAALGFSDSIRPEAKGFIASLKHQGIQKTVMLTGDRKETADAIAGGLGLDAVRAGLMPGGKTEEIRLLAKDGEVMMVGDGVNDAPSLAAASVGVAMGGLGSDVAFNAADVVLMRDRLDSISDLIRLGRRTSATVRFNFIFAGAMIATLALTSLTGRLPLPFAVVGHEGSTVLVILNGLRMLRGPGRPA